MDNWLAPLRLCPSVRLPVRSSIRPSVCLSGCPSVCLFISLSIRPSVLSQLSLRRRRLNVWVVALLLERRSFHKIVCSLHYALLQRPRSMFALHRNCCTSVRLLGVSKPNLSLQVSNKLSSSSIPAPFPFFKRTRSVAHPSFIVIPLSTASRSTAYHTVDITAYSAFALIHYCGIW